MSDTWDAAPLAPKPEAPAGSSWNTAPLAGPTPQQRAVTSANDNGEEAAKALSISKRTNIPAGVVQSDIPGYDAHMRRQDAIQYIQGNPFIAKYVDSNPLAASVSSDDYQNLEKSSQAVQALHPDVVRSRGVFGAIRDIPEIAGMFASQPGREKLWNALTKLPGAIAQGFVDTAKTAGQISSGEINLQTPEGMDKAIDLGLQIAFLSPAPKTARVGASPGVSPPGAIDDFLATVRGAQTRQEINDFLASKMDQPQQQLLITHAKAGAEALGKAVKTAQESTTKARAPDLYAASVEAHDPGNVHIDAAKLVKLYEKEGKSPAEGDGLLGFVPDLPAKMQDAAASGGEVTIPISQYLAHVDPAVHEGLKDSIRLHEDGVTGEEAKEAQKTIEAWHGTPHDFESFDLTKIGTGEGAQVYGHGLYFAERKDVAVHYKDTLADYDLVGAEHPKFGSSEEYAYSELAKNNGDYTKMFEDLTNRRKFFAEEAVSDPKEQIWLDKLDRAVSILKGWEKQGVTVKQRGALYKVAIHADPTHFLDYDKPFVEQSQFVQDKLTSMAKTPAQLDLMKSGLTVGEGLRLGHYPNSSDFQGPDFSKVYSEAGIPGIKYLDQGSRGAGDGTRNFVVFDDKLVKITDKNGKPIEAAVEAAVATDMAALGIDTGPFLTMLFKDAKSIGITESEFAKYSDKIARMEQHVLDKAVAVHRAFIAKSLTPEWKRNESAIRDEVTTELAAKGPFAAERFLRQNKIELGGDRIDQIADDLAPLFGFENGNALRQSLVDLETEQAASGRGVQAQLKDAIKAETAARMESRYGKLAENIAKEARQIALSDHVFDVLADEVRILANAAGVSPPLSRTEMVAWAKSSFERANVRDSANWDKLQRAVARGGREAEKALLKGDFLEAFQAKQRQMLAATLAKESLGLQKVIDQTEKKIDQFSSERTISAIDQTHLEQIRQMLDSVGVQNHFAPLVDTVPLGQFVADAEGQLAVAPWLYEGRPPKIADMTTEQFRAFADSLKSMEHVGRQVKSFDSAYGKAEVQNVIHDIKKELDRFDLIEQPLNPTVGQRAKALGRWIVAAHLLVERMLDYTDKFSPDGPLTRYLDRPLRDSNVKEIQLTEQVSKKLRALREYTDSSVNDLIKNDLIPDTLSSSGKLNMDRGNLRQLMLHMGNWSNIKKVVEGFGVNEADLRRMIDREAKEADWKWVQGMWDIFAGLKTEADAMQFRDTGVPADTLESVPFQTKFGDMTGGYAPIVYDRARSNIQGDIAAKNPIFDQHYVQATTPHGYTISRVQYEAPLDLTGALMASKIQGMIHDIAFREAVRQAARLINNSEFHAAMVQKWSAQYADLLPGWIKDIANSHNVDDSYATGAARVMAGIRQNITSSLIAFNPGTYMKHGVTAASMSVERVGAKALGSAAWEVGLRGAFGAAKDLLRSPESRPDTDFTDALRDVTDPGTKGESTREFILAKSAVMRARQRKFEESIRGAYEQASESGSLQTAKDIRHAAMNLGRFPVALSDAVSAMPTWYAAYKRAVLAGADDADAVFQADKEVSRAHGSGFVGDKPRVQRTGELMRWVTPLYTFWNHMANNYFQAGWDMAALGDTKRAEPNANVRSLSNKLFWLVVIPIAIEEMAGPAKDEHGDSLGMQVIKAVGRQAGASIIGLRDITNAAFGGYDPSIGMTGTLMKTISDLGKDIHKLGAKGVASRDWMIHLFSALGAATGVGGAQIGKTGSFVKDLATGAERPRAFNDYRQGLRTGHSKARVFK